MSPRNRRPGRSAKSAKAARRRTRPEQAREDDGDDLFAEIDAILAADDPLALLLMASHQMGVTDPQLLAVLEQDFDVPTLETFESLLFETKRRESSALLAALAALSRDADRRRRAEQEITDRSHSLPAWLTGMRQAAAEPRAIELPDPYGDGETLLVSVTLFGEYPLTAVVVVDHDLGTIADGHVLPLTLDQVASTAAAASDDDPAPREITGTDARARIADAVRQGTLIDPPVVTERWPFSRALLEWMISLQPDGGTGYEWPTQETAALVERFRASGYATGVQDPGNMLPRVLDFLAGRAPHDPLRMSPASVGVVYGWLTEDVDAPVAELAAVPDLLRAYTRFAHHDRGLPAALTEETLAAMDEYDPQYRKLINER